MRLIGYQKIAPGVMAKLYDIIRANMDGHHSFADIAYDAFLLGIIYGKREERARRRGSRS